MKEILLFKQTIAAKMKKNLSRRFCHGVDSTSTLSQRRTLADTSCIAAPSLSDPYSPATGTDCRLPALEEMIMQLEREEAASRKAKAAAGFEYRMSCVNNSDILRSARKALNQCPRFSLDGRDRMQRPSFGNLERVVWFKPGVVAKLMGLEAMAVPTVNWQSGRQRLQCRIKKENLRRFQRRELGKRNLLVVGKNGCKGTG